MTLPDFSAAALAEAERSVDALRAQSRQLWSRHAHGRMSWRLWGEGPPLLLVHGNYGSWTHWLRNISELASRRLLLVPDLPGFGESAPPAAESSPADIALLIEEGLPQVIELGEALRIAGFSMGGRFAGVLAARLAERAARLTLFSPGGLSLPVPERPTLERLEGSLTREARLAIHARNLARLMLSQETVDTLAAVLQERNVANSRFRPAFRRREKSLHEVLKQVRCPLVAAWGSRDPYVDPYLEERRDYVYSLPGPAEFRSIPGASHWAVYECPDFCNALLLEG